MKQKKMIKSRTIMFNLLMGVVEALHGGIHLMAPFMEPQMFAMITLGLGMIHAVGGIYLRMITRSAII